MNTTRQQIWNWLPTFLAVVEESGITAASRVLHVTPAAISRTIRLLESELGETLFNRVGRRLVLNDRGAKLHAALRQATITVDRGIAHTLSGAFSGALRVGSLGVLTDHFVMKALISLKSAYPSLLPEHHNLGSADAVAQVASGTIDVAFYYEDLTAEGLEVREIGQTTKSVYCGQGHPLFDLATPSQNDILAHEFSVPQIGDSGRVLDGWPVGLSRRIGMRITTLRANLDVCKSGILLCVLPDAAAFDDLRDGRLHRLASIPLANIRVFCARSIGSVRGGSADTLVSHVQTSLVDFAHQFGRFQ